MSRVKLTDVLVSRVTLPDKKANLVVWDTEITGFGLRIRPKSKSWLVVYRPAGTGRSANPKWLKLGSADAINTATARNLARVALGKIAGGGDPLQERKEQKRKERARLEDVLDRYSEDLERRSYVNYKVVISGLKTKMSALLSRDIRDITGDELATIEEKKAGRRGAARDFRSRARAFFNWCVNKPRLLKVSPLAGYRKERPTRVDRVAKAEHGRALSDQELRKIWSTADPETAFGRLVRFLVLTGCRRGEAAGLIWSMVDRKTEIISMPAIFTKQGRGHIVPITSSIGQVLDHCPIDTRSDYVFASPRSGGKMSGWTQLLRKFAAASTVTLYFHDLRRTFRTGLSRLGVSSETAELALGHARSDLEARYNRDTASGALREAFDLWSDHVAMITADDRAGANDERP